MAHDSAPTDAAGSGGVREAAARPQAEPADDRSSWAPLRHAAFTVLWTAALVSNVGAWMHELSVGWLMTELDPSPIMVAIVQSAATLPMFLLALPAGAMADILDRRRLLIGVLLIAAFAALGLGALTEAGRMTPWLLVLFTLALGAAAAFSAPTWQALIPQLVPRKDLPAAVVLVGAGGNLARAVGPALGGVVIGLYGAEAPFFINAFAFVGVVAALLWWRPAPTLARATPPEHVGGAMRAGVRYALASRPLRDTLARAVAFFLFAGAFSALLPLIARRELGAGPEHYGYLQMSVGLGAIASVAALRHLRERFGPDRMVTVAGAAMAAALVAFSMSNGRWPDYLVAFVAGASWLAALSNLSVSAQLALPEWVRARGLAIFLMIFYGALAFGGVMWGVVASEIGLGPALAMAGVGAGLAAAVGERWRLGQGEALDLTPSMHWPKPATATRVDPDRGPVMITVTYRVPGANRQRFLALMGELRLERLRNGALTWGVFEDVGRPGLFVETYTEASWIEHLRHHERVTQADRALQDRVRALVESLEVRHHVAPPAGSYEA